MIFANPGIFFFCQRLKLSIVIWQVQRKWSITIGKFARMHFKLKKRAWVHVVHNKKSTTYLLCHPRLSWKQRVSSTKIKITFLITSRLKSPNKWTISHYLFHMSAWSDSFIHNGIKIFNHIKSQVRSIESTFSGNIWRNT